MTPKTTVSTKKKGFSFLFLGLLTKRGYLMSVLLIPDKVFLSTLNMVFFLSNSNSSSFSSFTANYYLLQN